MHPLSPLEFGAITAFDAGGIPAWVPAVGTIEDVSLNTINDVADGDDLNQVASVLFAWSGLAYCPDYGARGSLLMFGAGHGYQYNAVYAYDIHTRLHKKEKTDAAVKYVVSSYNADTTTGWMWADAGGTTVQVGQLHAAHTYAGLVGLPSSAIAGSSNGWLFSACRNTMPIGGSQSSLGPAKLPLGAAAAASQLWQAHGSGPMVTSGSYGPHLWDSLRNRVCAFNGISSTVWGAVDLTAGTILTGSFSPSFFNYNYEATGYYDSDYDCYIIARYDSVSSATFELHVLKPGGTDDMVLTVSTPTQGGTPPPSAYSVGGWDWVQDWRSLIWYAGQGDNDVYFLKAPAGDPRTGTWTWSKQTLTGTARDALEYGSENPHYSRFRYIPDIDCCLWQSKTSAPVQGFRVSPP